MNEYNGPDALPIPPLDAGEGRRFGELPPDAIRAHVEPDRLQLGTLEIHGDRAALFGALARAQAGYQPIARTRQVDTGKYKFDYAPLEKVIEATQPALNAQGLAWVSVVAGGGTEDADLHTLLTHESGAFLHVVESLPPVDSPQARGSQITYKRRYQYQCLTGTSPEFDDDGNSGSAQRVEDRPAKQRQPPAPPQRAPERQEAPKPAPTTKAAPATEQVPRTPLSQRDDGLSAGQQETN